MIKTAIYYTDSQLDDTIATTVRSQLRKVFVGEIVASSLAPLEFGTVRLVSGEPRGYLTMFKQILACLDSTDADVVYFCEHDVLYPPEHFEFTPPDPTKFYYDLNWWKTRKDGLAVHWDAVQVSGLVCYRELARNYYASRVASFDPKNFDRKFEPTTDTEYETFWASVPHIDIRHEKNLTYNKWSLAHFRDKSSAVNFESKTIADIKGWNFKDYNDIISYNAVA